jgi:hypothetical protein
VKAPVVEEDMMLFVVIVQGILKYFDSLGVMTWKSRWRERRRRLRRDGEEFHIVEF